jgi:hypothetical protein
VDHRVDVAVPPPEVPPSWRDEEPFGWFDELERDRVAHGVGTPIYDQL